MTNNGWTQEEWKTFYELKTKANEWNITAAKKLLTKEIIERAERKILANYLEEEQ